jgi:hypothetical protein
MIKPGNSVPGFFLFKGIVVIITGHPELVEEHFLILKKHLNFF